MAPPQQKRRRSDVTRGSEKDQASNAEETLVQALQKLNANGVAAFVTVSLQCDGGVTVYSSEHIQKWTDRILPANTSERLRHAHSLGDRSKAVKDIDDDLVCPKHFQTDHGQIEAMKTGILQSSTISKDLPGRKERLQKGSRRRKQHLQAGFAEAQPLIMPPPDSAVGDPESDDEASYEPNLDQHILTIGDGPKVEAFLRSRLKSMQQLAVKRIAKAWIKGICPKKQARFPYHNKRREQNGVEAEEVIPKWWPDLRACRFIEPDHIRRSERLELCIHLLRLRPTPEELKLWNNNAVEPHRTHRDRGWVEFLKELAPPSLLCEMRDTEEKTSKRQRMVEDMYECAQMEEDYKNGALGKSFAYATAGYSYIQEDGKPLVIGKPRYFDVSDSDSEAESPTEHSARLKRRKIAPSTSDASFGPTQNNPIEAEHGKSGVATVSDLQSVSDDNMYDSFGPAFGDQPTVQTAQAFGSVQRPTASVRIDNQATHNSEASGIYYQQHCNWNPNEFIDHTWPQQVSPANSYIASSSSGGSSSTTSLFAPHPPPNVYALQQDYADSKPSQATDRAHYGLMAGIVHGDTVPNTPQRQPIQVVPMDQQSDHAALPQQTFRPNAFEYHGMPLQIAPEAMMLPSNGSSDFDLGQLDSKQPLGFEQNPLYGRSHGGQCVNPAFGQQHAAFRQDGTAQMDLGYYNQSSDTDFQAPVRMGRRFTTYG